MKKTNYEIVVSNIAKNFEYSTNDQKALFVLAQSNLAVADAIREQTEMLRKLTSNQGKGLGWDVNR